jgi:hypothetical protein
MPFRIFASGHGDGGHFTYQRVNLDFEKAIDAASTIQAAAGGDWKTKAGAAQAAYDTYTAGPSDVGAGAVMVGRMVMSELVQTGINYLAIKGGGDTRKVSLSARATHTLWPDTMRFIEVNLDFDNPGLAFMRSLKKALVDTDMYTVGVMRQISDTLSRYGSWLDTNGGDPWLSIQLSS